MTRGVPVPIDEETRLPHLVLPYDVGDSGYRDYLHAQWPRRLYETDEITEKRFHHTLSPYDLTLDEHASLAVRMSLGQVLNRGFHEDVHRRLNGPPPPVTLQEKFEHTVRACGGLASRWAVNIYRPDTDMLVYMDDYTYEQVTNPRSLCTERAYNDRDANYRRYLFGSFIMRYVIEQDLSYITGPAAREFVGTKNATRKKELGGIILKQVLDSQLDPLIPIHEKLRSRGFVRPSSPDLRLAIRKLIPKDERSTIIPALSSKLAG